MSSLFFSFCSSSSSAGKTIRLNVSPANLFPIVCCIKLLTDDHLKNIKFIVIIEGIEQKLTKDFTKRRKERRKKKIKLRYLVILKLKVQVNEKNKIVSTFNSLSRIMAISIAKKRNEKRSKCKCLRIIFKFNNGFRIQRLIQSNIYLHLNSYFDST